MHYMLVNLLHSHYIQHVMYVITYPLHAFKDANELYTRYILKIISTLNSISKFDPFNDIAMEYICAYPM